MDTRSGVIGSLAVAVALVFVASCSDSGSNELERIDGPAVVDPSFRPLDSVVEPRSTDVVVATSGG